MHIQNSPAAAVSSLFTATGASSVEVLCTVSADDFSTTAAAASAGSLASTG